MFNDGLLEEGLRLAGPHPQARVIDDVLQDFNAGLLKRRQKSPAVVGSGCGVRPGHEEDFVVAEHLQVLECRCRYTRASKRGRARGPIHDKEVDLSTSEVPVNGINEADAAAKRVHGANAADSNAVRAFGNLIVDIARGHMIGWLQPRRSDLSKRRCMRRLLLASLCRTVAFHSKSLRVSQCERIKILN